MECEMCGLSQAVTKARVEGTILNVCSNCKKFGVEIVETVFRQKRRAQFEESQESIVFGYGSKIKQKREELGLTQGEFAKRLQEKESVLSHVESQKVEPTIALAKKMKKVFSINLIETIQTEEVVPKTGEEEAFTIGDIIKVKKSRK